MTAALELGLSLPDPGSRHVRRELHRQLRDAIAAGRLAPGLQLPASRALAQSLSLSRNTVMAVYDQLLSEGLIVTRPGAGAFVATAAAATLPGQPAAARPIRYDLRAGLPDTASFPFDIWGRLTGRTLRQFARASSGYRAPAGHPALRHAIAGHLSFARALACDPDEALVTVGAQQAFDLIARTLVTPARPVVVVEDPGYPANRAAFAAAGADVRAVPVDGEGLIVGALPTDAALICVTPAHAFPMGVPLSPRRRAALLDFAARHDALILEDDYGGEFRFGPPLEPLRAAAPDRVLYVGTFSQSLLPALRIGFVLAPPAARAALVAARELTDWHGPAIEHGALAAFIAEGHLARHVRRMRKVYAQRRTALLAALAQHAGDLLEPLPAAAGLHVTVLARRPMDAAAVAACAAAAGVAVQDLSAFAADHDPPEGFVLGYGLIDAADLDAAVRELARAAHTTKS
jgi:GntR family transcriptional regulator/MocR family aminotransferase